LFQQGRKLVQVMYQIPHLKYGEKPLYTIKDTYFPVKPVKLLQRRKVVIRNVLHVLLFQLLDYLLQITHQS
jgi:hypothetical protein